MASSKTKRAATVAALSAALIIGGVAAAQADGDTATQTPCVHGKGKGMGTGAPGNGKGNGAERGWPHGCKVRGDKDDDEQDKKEKKEKKQPGNDDAGEVTASPGDGAETPSGGETPTVDVDASVGIDLPDVPAPAPAPDTVDDVLQGLLTPAGDVAGRTLETAGQATDLATNDVSAIAGLLAGVGAVSIGDGSAALEVAIPLSGALNLAGGTTRAVTGIVAGMVFAV